MAASNTVLIKFRASGDKALEKAILDLAKAQALLEGKARKYNKAVRRLKLDKEKLNKQFGLANKNSRLLSNSFATLRSKMLLVSFAMSMGVKQLIDFSKQAAKVESMSTAFNTLSGGAGNATVAIDKLRGATNDTMSDFDLFQQANNAMVLGVSKNSDEMAEMFDIAQRLGRALGRDTKSSVESLITGIGRQSRMMLDNIGIIVKVKKAQKAYAKANNTTVAKLTEAQKKQAFLNATMEAAREKVDRLGKETLASQDAFDRFTAASDNAATQIGQAFLPVIEPLVNFMASLMKLIDVDRVRNFGIALGVAGLAAGVLSGAFVTMAKGIQSATKALLAFNVAQIKTGWGAIAAGVGLATYTILELFDALKEEPVIKIAAEAAEDLAVGIDASAVALERYQAILKGISNLPMLRDRLDTLNAELEIEEKKNAALLKQGDSLLTMQQSGITMSKEQLEVLKKAEAAEKVINDLLATRAVLDEQILNAQIQNEIHQANLIPNLELEVALAKNKQDFKGAELELQNLLTNLKFREIELSEEELAKITALIEKKQEQLTLEEKIVGLGNQAIKSMQQVTSAWKENLSIRFNAEMETLKQSNKYKRANDRRKEILEKEINDKFAKEKKRVWLAEQSGKIGQAIMSTYTGAAKAWEQGGIFGGIMAGIVTAAGLAQVGLIATQQPPQFATGGLVGGRLHSQGGTMIEAEQGEFVMSRNATEALGIENLNRMNQGGGGGVSVTFTGNVMSQDFIENEAIPQIKEAIRRGADIGVS